MKGKGETERETQLKAEFQRRARRDRKTFLTEQCKETAENSMGKTRDCFKKTGYVERTFHARMDTTRDRNGVDLREAEEIKRWQEHTGERYKKGLLTQITMML